MYCRFLLSIDRRQSVSEAEDTVELAIEYKEKYNGLVVGVDLSGDPKVRNIFSYLNKLLNKCYCPNEDPNILLYKLTDW
jgi:hypothetical protein